MAEVREKPLAYIEWVHTHSRSVTDEADLFADYSLYVTEFYKDKRANAQNQKDLVVLQYVDLLKDITLNYTSVEERRFLSNIDFNNKHELEIVIPFYVKKIKQITQYLIKKRQEVQFSSIKNQFKGSEKGIQDTVRDTVIDLLSDPDFIELYPSTNFPSVSTVVNDLGVEITPLYDLYQHYYDIDPDLDKEVYVDEKNDTLYDLYIANVEQKNPSIWNDIERAVNDLFIDVPDLLLGGDTNLVSDDNLQLSVNVPKTVNDISDLPNRFFTGTDKQLGFLSLDVQKRMIEKFSGTDFYYLSTGTTATDNVSGLLYKATNPAANFLNRYWASHAVVSNTLNLKTDSNIGLFFTPNKQGVLNYQSLDFYYDLKEDNLLPNAVYIFPDPEKYATGRGNTKVDQTPVFDHRDDVSTLKSTRLNQSIEGEVINDEKLQKFYPYQSREESLGINSSGISRSTDDFDFWSGDERDIWSHPDVYKIKPLELPPIDSKIQDLLVSDQITYEWKTDIYGNNYALLKDSKPVRKTSEQVSGSLTKSATQDSVSNVNSSLFASTTAKFSKPETAYYNYQLSNYATKFKSATDISSTSQRPYDRKNTLLGSLYFRNVYSTEIGAASSSSLSGVFEKYSTNSDIFNEINNNVKNFDIVKDVIILETTHFLILEKFQYNLDNETFKSILPNKVIMSLSGKNTNIEKFANIFYVESDNEIYLTKTTLHPFLSGTNFKAIYPEVLCFNSNTNTVRDVMSLKTLIGKTSADNINEHYNTYKVLSANGFIIGDEQILQVEEVLTNEPSLYYETNLSVVSGEYINITTVDSPAMTLNEKEKTLTINYFGHDPSCNIFLFNQYYDISSDPMTVKQLDLFKPDYDVFDFNVDGYLGHTGTDAPVISSIVEGPPSRGLEVANKFVSYDSFKSSFNLPVAGDTADDNSILHNMSYLSVLSGRKNTPTRLYDTGNNTIRLGAGLSASAEDEVILGTDEATYTHQSSYITLAPALSGGNNDITICFDFALYTLTSGNSGYAHISQHQYSG